MARLSRPTSDARPGRSATPTGPFARQRRGGPMQILITGGTNGIGLAAAQMLAARGANVAIVGRNEGRTQAAAARIRAVAAAGVAAGTFIADLSSQAAARQPAAERRSRSPRVAVHGNHAGAMY